MGESLILSANDSILQYTLLDALRKDLNKHNDSATCEDAEGPAHDALTADPLDYRFGGEG